MRTGRFFWKVFLGNALLMMALLGICTALIVSGLNRQYRQQLTESLLWHARFLSDVGLSEARGDPQASLVALSSVLPRLSKDSELRVTLIDRDGVVLADTHADESKVGNHGQRPEVSAAMATGRASSSRWSQSTSRQTHYVALRVGSGDDSPGVIRVATPVHNLFALKPFANRLVLGIGAAGLAACALLALGLAQVWSRPIQRMTAAAQMLAHGELTARADVAGHDEMSQLGRSLNRMRDRLVTQVETADRQRRILEAMLSQLGEGVVLVGEDARVVLANPAARRMLQQDGKPGVPAAMEGRLIEQCIPNYELQSMLLGGNDAMAPGSRGRQTGAGESRTSPDVPHNVKERRLQIKGTAGEIAILARAADITLPAFGDNAASTTGRLLVMTDISDLSRTIQVKADFAGNASHELRTPLAAIRASIETLLSMQAPEEMTSFLQMIERHCTRLEAIVRDLLDLSRLEQPGARFQIGVVSMTEVMAELEEHFAKRLIAKKLNWTTDVPPDCRTVHLSKRLLRPALENLIDNAIKFTEPGGTISTECVMERAATGARTLQITVADTGCGIPKNEQERVFERFYQVQRARSGGADVRGTGLGLSIVRYAVNAMKGRIEMASEVGRGTRMTLHIPQPVSTVAAVTGESSGREAGT